MFQDKSWLHDFEELLPQQQSEVVDFIQFLKYRKPSLQGVVDSSDLQQSTNPLLQFAGVLSDTDLSAPEDLAPEVLEAF